jgi:hypothetical protein
VTATTGPEYDDDLLIPDAVLLSLVEAFDERFTMVDAAEMCLEWLDAADAWRRADLHGCVRLLAPPWLRGPEAFFRVAGLAILAVMLTAWELAKVNGHPLGQPGTCPAHGRERFYYLRPLAVSADADAGRVANARAAAQALSMAANGDPCSMRTILLARITPEDQGAAAILLLLMEMFVAANDAALARATTS